jgi:hypothetical protein
MRIVLAAVFLVAGCALLERDATFIVGALLLGWVPHLIVEHVRNVPRHPPTLDELLQLDDESPAGDTRHD